MPGLSCLRLAALLLSGLSVLVFAFPLAGLAEFQNTKYDIDHAAGEPAIRVSVNLVTVGVLVTGSKNRAVEGLTVDDFTIYEDGKRQKIAVFSAEEQPISLAIVLDKSNSMGESTKMEQAKAAAIRLVGSGHRSNEVAQFVFHHEVSRIVNFTTDHEQVQSAILRTVAERGGSSVYDALIEALEYTAKATYPRQAVVMITDGADQHSTHNLDELVRAVQTSEAQVYLIGYFSPTEDQTFQQSGKTVPLISGQEIDNPRFVFKRLAVESGAECFFPKSQSDLKQAIDTISKDLLQQYTLAYYSNNPAKGTAYRHIEVKVNRKGVRVRTRNGYRLAGPTEQVVPVSASRMPDQRPEPRSRPQPFESKVEHHEDHVIYREDFSDPTSGWPNKSGFFYDQGRYHITEGGSAAANGPWLKDVRASLSLQFTSGTAKKGRPQEIVSIGPISPGVTPLQVGESLPGAGLVFRLNERGFYAFLISNPMASQHAHFKLVRKDIKNTVTDLLPWTQEWAPGQIRDDHTKLAVTCQADFIQLYINDRLVGSIHDGSLKDGITGMILFGNGHAIFDDLVVEELP